MARVKTVYLPIKRALVKKKKKKEYLSSMKPLKNEKNSLCWGQIGFRICLLSEKSLAHIVFMLFLYLCKMECG